MNWRKARSPTPPRCCAKPGPGADPNLPGCALARPGTGRIPGGLNTRRERDYLTRRCSFTQLVSQVLPSSYENACSHLAPSGPTRSLRIESVEHAAMELM